MSRQRPTRYVFRAGCLLSTEEFRYLRTVRVTAAIHQYLGQKLAHLSVVTLFRHILALGRRQYVYFHLRVCTYLCFS